MNALSRRRFLKISAATVVAAGAAGPAPRALAAPPAPAGGPAGCAHPDLLRHLLLEVRGIATVRDGQLWKIEGNPLDPLCQGRLCPRGTGGIGAHSDPDRLRTPLIRTHERGEDKWQEVTWDEALDYIASG
jgi:thiosulfate reductase/polysulfide reductase chain A